MGTKKIYHDHIGLVSHLTNLSHVSQLLLDQGAFKHDQHYQSEYAVVPVLIEAPKRDAEYLKYEEWGDRTLFEELLELGNNHVQAMSEQKFNQ